MIRVSAELQNVVLGVILPRRVLGIRELTHLCPLSYHQVASCLQALVSKGYVRRIRAGVYEATEEARLLELSPERQVLALKARVSELETLVKKLLSH